MPVQADKVRFVQAVDFVNTKFIVKTDDAEFSMKIASEFSVPIYKVLIIVVTANKPESAPVGAVC